MSAHRQAGSVGRRTGAAIGIRLLACGWIVLDGALALGAGWSPAGSRLEQTLLGSTFLGLLLGATLLIVRPARAWAARCWMHILVVSLVCTSAVGLAELVLRTRQPEFHLHPARQQREFTPVADLMPGIEGVSRFTTSSLGLRGSELVPLSRPRVLCLGGSTTMRGVRESSRTGQSHGSKAS